MDLTELNKEQLAFLEKIGIGDNIGKNGVEKIEDILYKNAIDIAAAHKKIQEMYQSLSQGIARIKKIEEGLGQVLEDIEEVEITEGVLIRIVFTRESSIETVSDFKKWGEIWYNIGRGISMAYKKTPEDIKVVGAGKGSIIIDLATVYVLAKAFASIVQFILDSIKKYLDIRLKIKQLKELDIKEEELSPVVEAVGKIKEESIEKIVKKILKDSNAVKEKNHGEIESALKKSVTELFDFIKGGGDIDFVLPEVYEESDDKEKKLKSMIKEIRKSEERIKQLTQKKEE